MDKNKTIVISGDSLNLFELYKRCQEGIPGTLVDGKNTYNQKLISSITSKNGYLEDFEKIQENLFPKEKWEGKVSFLPLNRLNEGFDKQKYISIINEVIESGEFTTGPYIEIFEKEICQMLSIKNTILCSSGTDALMIALKAVGVSRGDEVIIPPNSFAATENAVFALGAIPKIVDIERQTYTLCPKSVEKNITSKTKCILPVHLYGNLSRMEELFMIGKKHGLKIVEDACQAIGLKGVGEHSDCAVISFNPFKNLGGLGKAGGILTNNDTLAEECHSLSYHGFVKGKKNVKRLSYGFNSRIDNMQAAILSHKLKYLSVQTFKRICLADRYINILNELEKKEAILLPQLRPDKVWHLFPIQILENKNRDEIKEILRSSYAIETEIYYPLLSHHQKTGIFKDVNVPNAEEVHSQLLFLPFHPHLSFSEQDRVVEALTKIV